MKIISLQTENVKRLSAVEVVPGDKGLVIVAGKNGQGKSSVLDSIMFALAGADSLPSKPVRKGEDKATVKVDLGELTVIRTMTSNGNTSLVVRNKDNERQETPQAILDKLFSNLTFDPLEFRTMKPDKRSETLCALLGLDFKKEDYEIDTSYSDRTLVNREIKTLEASLKGISEYPDAPKEEVSAAEVVKEQQAASEHNRSNQKVREAAAEAKNVCNRITQKMVYLSEQADKLTLEVERVQKHLAAVEAEAGELKEAYKTQKAVFDDLDAKAAALSDIDLAPFADRAKEVEITNRKVQANRTKAEKRKQLAAKVAEAEAFTKKIEKLESTKRKRIAEAKFPVTGLGLSDTREVEFNGVPFEQCSTADQLKISISMGLAMNPKLKVLLVRQGNDLDADNLALVAKMAEEAGAQIWLERVSTDGDVAVIIEDGHVKEAVSISSTSTEEKTLL